MIDFFCSLSFFTRIPTHCLYNDYSSFSFARSVWIWPICSAVIGSIEGFFLYIFTLTSLSASLIAFLGLGFHLILTGGLHEDGLADCADGFGGGYNSKQKLAIMKDSRLGTYGVLTLFIILGIQINAMTSLLSFHQKIVPLIIIIAVLSRSSMLGPILILVPTNPKSSVSQLNSISIISCLIHLGITIGLCFLLFNWKLIILYVLTSIAISLLFSLITYQQIKGYNGDSLGALQVLTATALFIISILLLP